jgi:hypothetical protein
MAVEHLLDLLTESCVLLQHQTRTLLLSYWRCRHKKKKLRAKSPDGDRMFFDDL